MLTYSELRNYIIQARPDDTIDLFDAAIRVFENYEVPGYMEIYDRTLGESTQLEEGELIPLLIEDTRLILMQLLQLQGIQVHDELRLSTLIELTDATDRLPDYEDRAALSAVLTLEESAEERYAQLIALVSSLRTEEVLSLLLEVDENMLTRFQQQLTETTEAAPVDETLQAILQTYRRYKTRILKDQTAYADRYLAQQSTIGLPFSLYLNLYQKDQGLSAETTAETRQQTAIDLLGLACLSEDGWSNPLITLRQHLSTLYADLDTVTQLDIALSKLITELHRHG